MIRGFLSTNRLPSFLRKLGKASSSLASNGARLSLLAGLALVTPSVAHAQLLGAAASAATSWAAGAVGDFIGSMLVPIALVLLTLSNFILWVAGLVFNWAVIRTVYQFGTYFGTSDSMLVAWGIMRDVANIGLLFGFIFMGVLLILNVEGGGHGHGGGMSAKKAIPRLIIFAVLLNFSLFTTQAVIDVSNGLASVFAEQAGQKCAGLEPTDPCVNVGIAGLISDRAGIFSIWKDGPSPFEDPLKTAIVYIGLSIFVMITAMVLIAGAIMFVYRAVVLSFLMITSPIGFAGMAIPSLKKIADEWWSKLLSQTFFAPVYLLLIFISLKLTETLSAGVSGKGLAAALAGTGGTPGESSGNIQVVLVFAVVIGFMMASLVTANKMGAVGAKFATKTAGALTLGTAGFVGRRTLGRASNYAANRIASSNFAQKNPGIARSLYGVANAGATASYSARGAIGGAVKGTGLDLGKPNKAAAHGFHGIEEKLVKERTEFAKKIKPTADQKGPGAELEAEVKEQEAKYKAELAPLYAEVGAAQKDVDAARASGDQAAIDSARTALKDKMSAYTQREAALMGQGTDFAKLKKAASDWRKRGEKQAQDQYVESLNSAAHVGPFNPLNATFGPTVDHHAAEEIVKNANKSKLDKALDDFKKAAGSSKDDDDDHGDDHAPAAPATGGAPAGGGHAH
jgi:hypothetical protein